MSDCLFDPPVLIKHNDYLIQEIVSLADAIDVLDDWPETDRDLIHETVWRVCGFALDGRRPVEVARKAFSDFARKKGILEDLGSAASVTKHAARDIGGAPR